VRVFQQQKLPEEMPERVIQEPIGLLNLITEAGFARGTGEARRLIQQNAVSLDDVKLTDQELVIQPSDQPRILRVGKRNFLRLV
jgi:tyrosyl-tRNA synthetase